MIALSKDATTLPTTPTGKILKHELREEVLDSIGHVVERK